MNELTKTAMFSYLSSHGAMSPTEPMLQAMYDDFARSMLEIGTKAKGGDLPACFTLSYTQTELEQLTPPKHGMGEGEKPRNKQLPA